MVAGLVLIVPPAITLWYWTVSGGPDRLAVAITVCMYLLTGFGVTIGHHRYFSHRAFRIRYEWFRYTLAILGAMALVGLISEWQATHDPRHHRFADKPGDPQSPHRYGDGLWAKTKGAIYAHIRWFFVEGQMPILEESQNDPVVRRIDRLLPLIVLAGLLLPGCMGVLLRCSFEHCLIDVVWGGFFRMFLVHHSTWSVNSVGHLWGSRPFVTNDKSANNRIVAAFALGEGFQCTHHAFPNSACYALLPGQVDSSYEVIKVLEKIGIVTDVIVPSREHVESMLAQ